MPLHPSYSRVNCDSATGSAGASAVVLTIFLIMKKYSRTLEEGRAPHHDAAVRPAGRRSIAASTAMD